MPSRTQTGVASRARAPFSVGVFLILASACSSPGSVGGNGGFHSVGSLVLSTLFIRRPVGAPADPQASPGGEDYQSDPLPNPRLDCAAPESLWRNWDLKAIRSCLNEVHKEITLVYQLQKTARPLLSLQKEDPGAPSCVKELLKEIPVPREIFFEGVDDRNHFDCYASGIRPEDNDWWAVRLISTQRKVRIDLPLTAELSDDRSTQLLLLSWALAPFQDPTTNRIPSQIVPEALCRKCLGDSSFIRSPRLALPLWPPPDQEP